MPEVTRQLCERGEFIQTDEILLSSNPLSQSIRVNEWLFCSGQLGLDPESKKPIAGGPAAETERVMKNLDAVLKAGGASFDTVVKTTIFTTKLTTDEAAAVNSEYEKYFSRPYPARSLVEVAGLNKGCCVEIECVALVKQQVE